MNGALCMDVSPKLFKSILEKKTDLRYHQVSFCLKMKNIEHNMSRCQDQVIYLQFSGVFLSLFEGRSLHKVFNLRTKHPKTIDAIEQSYLFVATNEEEFSLLHSHCEININFVLNNLARKI